MAGSSVRRFVDRVGTLVRYPTMGPLYLRWLAGRATGRGPYRRFGESLRAGQWREFSEFWTVMHSLPPEQYEYFRRFAPEPGADSVAVDVGANLGLFSLALAELGFRRVVAFEPMPTTFAMLRSNLEDNPLVGPRVCAVPSAVGGSAGEIEFVLPRGAYGNARIYSPGDKVAAGEERTRVPIVTLDDFCDREGIRSIGFLKIDVEGYEPGVLRGARRLLEDKRIGAIWMEVSPPMLELAGHTKREVWDLVHELGYVVHGVDDRFRESRRIEVEDFGIEPCSDVLCLPG